MNPKKLLKLEKKYGKENMHQGMLDKNGVFIIAMHRTNKNRINADIAAGNAVIIDDYFIWVSDERVKWP